VETVSSVLGGAALKRTHSWMSLPVGAILAWLCLQPATSLADDEAASAPAIPRPVTQVLEWLPPDTETVFVARGPMEIISDDRQAETQEFESYMESLPSSLYRVVDKGRVADQLIDLEVTTAVEGSRHFRASKGLGLMPYEGCQILVFHEKSHAKLSDAMKALFEDAPRTFELAGRRVAVFEEKLEDDIWTTYLTMPRTGVLLFATHEGYLRDMLKRMEGKREKRAFPRDLPEWKHVDTNAKFWALRHFDSKSAKDDPTSPLSPHGAASVFDAEAVGFVFWWDPDHKAIATVRQLSQNDEAVNIAISAWNDPAEGLIADVHQLEPGVVEIKHATGNPEIDLHYLFLLLAYLGHAIAL